MSRIALITQFYPPEPCAAANRIAAMAKSVAESGHETRVYTAMPSFPSGVIAAPYTKRTHCIDRDGKIVVERVWTYVGKSHSARERFLHWFAVSAAISAQMWRAAARYDLIVVSSPPITLALPALLYSFLGRVPLVVDVRDVFPEVAIKMGAWKSGSVIAVIVGRVAEMLYRRAKLITCVTESARGEIIARNISPAKVLLAPNGFDEIEPSNVAPYAPASDVRDVVFVGNMGLATGLNVLLDAASRLRHDRSIRFVLIGGGADFQRLQARARDEQLTNVLFTGTLTRQDALRALADASVTIVPLIPTIVDSLPTKLFDAMLVGTPIVVSAAGEARSLVELADVGLAAEPGDPDALIAALRRVLDEPELAARFRCNGPRFVRKNYDRSAIMRRLAVAFTELSR